LLKCLRAHGWTRELSNRAELERDFSNVDPRFLFVNVGFNLRPMEIQAALGIKQLEKLPAMNASRVANRELVIRSITSHPSWKGQFEFPEAPAGAEVIWFGFSVLLRDEVKVSLRDYLTRLSAVGIENRPIVSGNFARQPGYQLVLPEIDAEALVGAERIHERGFFIGLHSSPLTKAQTDSLADTLLRELR
jgi:CDP-6-deoxy-D-xylo-4-hexulose-3-dehydrase